jgi:hypothetical protein
MKHTAIASLVCLAVEDLPAHVDWYKVAALLIPLIVGVVQALRRPPRREPKPRRVPTVSRSVLPLAFGLFVLACSVGCVFERPSSIVRALGSNTNRLDVSIRSPWGTVDVRRNDPTAQ